MLEDEFDPYCNTCGTCGIIGCCGIFSFLKQHVIGKTNCKNEHGIVLKILDLVNDTVHETMVVDLEKVNKIYQKMYKAQQY